MIIQNISEIYKRVSHAAMRAGRDPQEVKVMAVTKTVGPELVLEAVEAGIRLIGENYVQEAEKKAEALKGKLPETVSWHLIGHLQKNKVKKAVNLFDVIESLDSIELAERINRMAKDLGKFQRVLVQVKLAEEVTKSGIPEDRVQELLDAVSQMEHLRVEGLMLLPPFFEDPEKTRPFFRRLRQLRDQLHEKGYTFLKELSMGMSHDYEVAVEEGATVVRIGTAIFG
ncbi:MAG: YggS family pyridoxal phosphate-dependent enzyme, partial [Nitrospirae bacterium]